MIVYQFGVDIIFKMKNQKFSILYSGIHPNNMNGKMKRLKVELRD
jgi:hypothetical protein